mgnify:CR=1 FL=1
MSYKEMVITLAVLIFVIALSLTIYKKNIRKNAKGKEIKFVASFLSIGLTSSLAYGLEFKGLPYALPAYVIIVYMLQYGISQKFIDMVFKVAKAYFKKKTGIEIKEE